MRSHLLKCLKQDKFTPFPLAKIQEKNDRTKKLQLSNAMEQARPIDNPDLWCTQCEKCLEWFHKKCSPTMFDSVFRIKNVKWVCPKYKT